MLQIMRRTEKNPIFFANFKYCFYLCRQLTDNLLINKSRKNETERKQENRDNHRPRAMPCLRYARNGSNICRRRRHRRTAFPYLNTATAQQLA